MLLVICKHEISKVPNFWFDFEMTLSNLIISSKLKSTLYVITDTQESYSFIENSYSAWSQKVESSFKWRIHFLNVNQSKASITDEEELEICLNAKKYLEVDNFINKSVIQIDVMDLYSVNDLLLRLI